MQEVFDGDERVGLAQEMMGYALTADTSQQKLFFLAGPPRSFKGTFMFAMKGLLGGRSYGVLDPNALAKSTFALWPLVDARVAAIPDMRLPRGDNSRLVQALLNISGEDPVQVDRKNKPQWDGKLSCRVYAAGNELPTFRENSAALANRWVVLRFTKSFLGKEDHDLRQKLSGELPGILNWAIEGLRRLQERGRFELPQSAEAAVRDMLGAGNPVARFVMECCELGEGYQVSSEELRPVYETWCNQESLDPECPSWFGRKLTAAFPDVKTKQKVALDRDGKPFRNGEGEEVRKNGVHGLRLRKVDVEDSEF